MFYLTTKRQYFRINTNFTTNIKVLLAIFNGIFRDIHVRKQLSSLGFILDFLKLQAHRPRNSNKAQAEYG